MKKYQIILMFLIIFLLQGCKLDPYKNGKYAESAIDAWFLKDESNPLGEARRKQEEINEIISKVCTYETNDQYQNYIYSCKIEYKPIGETVIPLSKNKTITVYVALTFKEDRTYSYIVYHSSSKDEIWLYDEALSFGKQKEEEK